ncbi:MAG: hypothetical protein J2P25_09470 [Nocardiopsaceae bacterium]|nr:hypothetical protein [Nocardiopsaceae bacterium]
MSSWRENASQQAQDDLDGLLNAALSFAQQQLARRGQFLPYAAAVQADGETRMVAVDTAGNHREQPASAMAEACQRALADQRAEIRAGAVVSDVRMAGTGRAWIWTGS